MSLPSKFNRPSLAHSSIDDIIRMKESEWAGVRRCKGDNAEEKEQ